MKRMVENVLLKPMRVEHCSQTLYESLQFCVKMYELTRDSRWDEEGRRVIKLVRMTQQHDGGFDIGYDFDFGRIHKRGWSSAPECEMLVSLIEYGISFGFGEVMDIIEKGIGWILNNSSQIGSASWMIPYCPAASEDVMVYNGVSFSLAPLAMYHRFIRKDQRIKEIHDGFLNYLSGEFDWERGFWRYSDQSRGDLNRDQRRKVDNYHLGQQLEMHCRSYECVPREENLKLIRRLADYLLTLHQDWCPEPLPYLNLTTNEKMGVHLWGYASLINGFLQYYRIQKESAALEACKDIFEWVTQNAWLGDHFACVYHSIGTRMDRRFYPRSDAWVINNLVAYMAAEDPNNDWLQRTVSVYENIVRNDFSGYENHVLTNGKKLYGRLLQFKRWCSHK
ncbi:MAG: hypothetical protein ACNY01_07795 [Desulfobacteria bacterium]